MARTAITVLELSRNGNNLSTVAADPVNGNYFVMPGQSVLCSFFSAGGGTVTVKTNATVDGLTVPDRTLTLTAATVFLWRCIGAPHIQTGNEVWLDFSGATSVAIYAE